ncbi:MAG: exodeoxyribonuclease I [Hahellaceae bacterium]|nr:exodeoxyribonuclease I [Hahellaceae bacterium]
MTSSIFWHDYETFGADPQRDRPSQFAGVRTDLDLNIIGDPLVIYCQPAEDMLPAPEACLITGITPQKAREEGFIEAEFIRQIHEEMSQPGTCIAGYNNIRFDDELTRNTLYRNFYDPYEHEWKNGNSRWDVIDMVRLVYALRPEGIVWPRREDGSPSFRLEELTQANGIVHEAAHDAMSDVYATIALAKLIKEKKPKLYDFVFSHRSKHSLRSLIDTDTMKPLFHVSSKYPANQACCAVVAPIVAHPVNSNGVIVYDLRVDPALWWSLSVEEIQRRMFSPREALGEDEIRVPLKTVHLNKAPILTPTSVLKGMIGEPLARLKLDGEATRTHLAKLRSLPGLKEKIAAVFESTATSSSSDPDLQIYSGGFFSDSDRQMMGRVRNASRLDLAEDAFAFQDARLPEMLFRYKARNYPDILTPEEQERWEGYRSQRLNDPVLSPTTFAQYFATLQKLAANPELSARDRHILEDLHYYGESVYPAF